MLALSLSGCATQRAVTEENHNVGVKANEDFQASRTPLTPSSSFQVDQGFYAARRPIEVTTVNPKAELPAPFYRPTKVNIQNPVSLSELAANISSGSGIRVLIAPDVNENTNGAASAAASTPPPAAGNNATAAPPGGLPPLPGADGLMPTAGIPGSTTNGTTSGLNLNGLQFVGNFSGLLDTVTGKLNLSWRWDGQQITIYRYETRLFRLSALAGDSTVNAKLSTKAESAQGGSGGQGGSSGGGLSGSSGQDTTVNAKLDVWSDVDKALKSTLAKGSTYSMIPSAGLLTVRATPSELADVETQMKEFNRVYSRSVILKIDVYSIENSNGDDYGLDWSAFWKNAGGFGLQLASTGNTAGANGAAIGPSFGFTKTGGAFDGSKAVVAALSTLGNTSLVTSSTAITLNGQTVPVNVSREQAYLQSYSTTLNGGTTGTSTTTLTPGVVTEGFSMNFTPRILEGNTVMMRYAIDLSNIENIATFTSPDGLSAIQLPARSVRNFLQNVNIHSGESLMLTGFQQVQGKDTSSGPFSAKAWALGGRRTSNSLNRTIVIIVTPYITQQ
jgi:type IVB pilus formation R64 PilN family outer membrane protein